MTTSDPSAPDPGLTDLAQRGGLALVGCGKMGGALLEGWLAAGLAPEATLVVEPAPTPSLAARLGALGVRLALNVPEAPAPVGALVMAVKPQMMGAALPHATTLLGPDAVLMSVAAGSPIALFEAAAPGAAVVRAMPNTPASIGAGVTALVANAAASPAQRALAEALARVVGETLWLESEAQMDAVTGVSGSGPAYVFHMIEALAAAGAAEGLPQDLAMRLARATVSGAGALAAASEESAETLRRNVTSPGGTTAAGLDELMHERDGLTPLMRRTVAAAAARSRALAKG
ncbi:MAG: pyrroline-5-carboxylate reductase [Pseudomonadota bacterium]